MRKATLKNFYIRSHYGNLGQIMNAREEISRGNGEYGVGWKFNEVSKEEFLNLLKNNSGEYIFCAKTLSGKYVEIDMEEMNNYKIEGVNCNE